MDKEKKLRTLINDYGAVYGIPEKSQDRLVKRILILFNIIEIECLLLDDYKGCFYYKKHGDCKKCEYSKTANGWND